MRPSVVGQLGGLSGSTGGLRTRVHGDYHLGQVLYTGGDFVIIDFEGEPGRPLAERRQKRSPLFDVAGMLRSFSYAASGSLIRRAERGGAGPERGATDPADAERLARWARAWTAWVSAAFLGGYRRAVAGTPAVPSDDAGWVVLLEAFLLEKAFYELEYELNNRPDWVAIPLRGIIDLLSS